MPRLKHEDTPRPCIGHRSHGIPIDGHGVQEMLCRCIEHAHTAPAVELIVATHGAAIDDKDVPTAAGDDHGHGIRTHVDRTQ